MSKKGYETVVEMAKRLREPIAAMGLKEMSPEKRARTLEGAFLSLAMSPADEMDKSAFLSFSLLMKSLEDLEWLPLIKQKKGMVHLFTSEAEAESFSQKIQEKCTLKTIKLYLQIADFKRNEFGKYVQDPDRVASKKAALFNTKKAMLERIALQWKNTPNDHEAIECFIFLWAVYELTLSFEEREVCEKVIREITKKTPFQNFSPVRLIDHRLLLTQPDIVFSQEHHHREELEKILMHAWINNIDPGEVTNIFRAMQPIIELEKDIFRREDDKAPYVLLGHVSEEIARLHKNVKELIRSMKFVPGRIRVSYLDRNHAKLSVEVEIVDRTYFHREKKTPESMGHSWFEIVRDYIMEWLEGNHNYAVTLMLFIKWEGADKLLFSREDSFTST